MLGTGHALVFPAIRFINDGEFKRRSKDPPRSMRIYRLDWEGFDKRLQDKHERWRTKYHPNKEIPYFPGLPSSYDCLTRDFVFALDNEYHDEIQRCARQANGEWKTTRRFDTSIREMCLKPAIAYVLVAFDLLADCIYDPDTKSFSRAQHRIFAGNMMAYRFWAHQTGRACIPGHAEVPALRKRLERFTARDQRLGKDMSEFAKALGAFLDALDAHQETYAKMYDEIRMPGKLKKASIGKARVKGPVEDPVKFDRIKG